MPVREIDVGTVASGKVGKRLMQLHVVSLKKRFCEHSVIFDISRQEAGKAPHPAEPAALASVTDRFRCITSPQTPQMPMERYQERGTAPSKPHTAMTCTELALRSRLLHYQKEPVPFVLSEQVGTNQLLSDLSTCDLSTVHRLQHRPGIQAG